MYSDVSLLLDRYILLINPYKISGILINDINYQLKGMILIMRI